MKILLFGKNGQVGWELQRSLAPLGELVALDRHSMDFCGDLTNLDGIRDTVEKIRPEVIVNAAAYTAVDKAESDAAAAHTVNAQAPGVLAEAASAAGAWLVHYSTDYVFDGSGSKPWEETDPTGPLSVYGRTKLEGEQLIAKNCTKHLVFRTSWVHSPKGGNFIKTILKLARDRERLSVVNDQFGAPTGAGLIADVTAHALGRVFERAQGGGSDYSGLYHLAAQGEVSWYGYAQWIVSRARQLGASLALAPSGIHPVTSAEFPQTARRPFNSRLNCSKLKNTFGLPLPGWESGVEETIMEVLRLPPADPNRS